jgi:hypothetical protein
LNLNTHFSCIKVKRGAKKTEIVVWELGFVLTTSPCENSVFSKPCNGEAIEGGEEEE